MKEMILETLKAIRHPIRAFNKIKGKIQSAQSTDVSHLPTDPAAEKNALFLAYGRLARTQGFDRLYIALSFDCDTPEDIPAAEQVHTWLSKRGIKATYAVPGAQLLQGAQTYRRLLDMGADFINHGARPHAEWHDGRYWSMTFYNELTIDEVIEDIKKGHEICQRVLGRSAVGFRAPHFGYFQTPKQREVMYTVLKDLGYLYSTSTLPEYGLLNGPVVKENGIIELPLSGSYANPFAILDSWNYIISPNQPVLKEEYTNLFIQTVRQLLDMQIPGFLNYYVDPAHVCKGKTFYQAMEYLLAQNLETVHFAQLLEIAE